MPAEVRGTGDGRQADALGVPQPVAARRRRLELEVDDPAAQAVARWLAADTAHRMGKHNECLAMLKDKKLENPWRKHGNIPL